MSMTNYSEKDLIAFLSGLIIEKDADVPHRLEDQDAALRELKCTNPAVGSWIDACDFPFLIETLLLSVAVFSQEFPNVKLTAEERREFANALEAHCESCAHCHLKRAYDIELQARVRKVFVENRQAFAKAIGSTAGRK